MMLVKEAWTRDTTQTQIFFKKIAGHDTLGTRAKHISLYIYYYMSYFYNGPSMSLVCPHCVCNKSVACPS